MLGTLRTGCVIFIAKVTIGGSNMNGWLPAYPLFPEGRALQL